MGKHFSANELSWWYLAHRSGVGTISSQKLSRVCPERPCFHSARYNLANGKSVGWRPDCRTIGRTSERWVPPWFFKIDLWQLCRNRLLDRDSWISALSVTTKSDWIVDATEARMQSSYKRLLQVSSTLRLWDLYIMLFSDTDSPVWEPLCPESVPLLISSHQPYPRLCRWTGFANGNNVEH